MLTWLSIISLAASLGAASPAKLIAPAVPHELVVEGTCSGEDCSAEWLAETLEVFGLEDAAVLARSRRSEVRAFTTNGYGQDMPAIIVKNPDRANVSIQVIPASGLKPRPFEARLGRDGQAATSLLLDAVEAAEVEDQAEVARNMIPSPPGSPPEEIILCAHGWTTVVEVIRPGSVTRQATSACDDRSVVEAVQNLAAAALAQFPPCDLLTTPRYRGALGSFEACSTLSGEPKAAVAVRLKFDVLLNGYISGREEGDFLAAFADGSVLDWQGVRSEGPTAILAAWKRERAAFGARSIRGASPGRVFVEGVVHKCVEGPAPALETCYEAPFSQRWIKVRNDWRVRETSVGAFVQKSQMMPD